MGAFSQCTHLFWAFCDRLFTHSRHLSLKRYSVVTNKKAKLLATKGGFNEANVKDWLGSVTDHDLSLMGFNKDALIPLYELVDTKYAERRNEMMAYYDGKNGQISSDFDSMVQSTITKVSLPQFDSKGTLVKDIMLGGQKVGIICNEFIPQINMEKRVNVVYPVINGKPRLNLGYFLGDSDHKPGRCSWSGNSVSYEAAEDMPYGETTTLYLSGASVSAKLAHGDTSRDGVVRDAWMTGTYYKNNQNNITYNYPIVKIANKIWTREDYIGYTNASWRYYPCGKLGGIKVAGWEIPTAKDFNDMKDMLVKYDCTMPGLMMFNDAQMSAQDLTGFNLQFEGIWQNDKTNYVGEQTVLWTRVHTKYNNSYVYCTVLIQKNGEMITPISEVLVGPNMFPIVQPCLRMVKEM